MRCAYADPPYLGMCGAYGHHHPDGKCWNDLSTHADLVARLCDEFPDGWAMSLHTPSMRDVLPLCPADARVAAWVKPFASFKPGVNPAYCWEPVIFRGGRKRGRRAATVRDYVSCSIALRKGFFGAKPDAFCFWVFDLLGLLPTDDFVDLFPGSGAVGSAWARWRRNHDGLFVTSEAVG